MSDELTTEDVKDATKDIAISAEKLEDVTKNLNKKLRESVNLSGDLLNTYKDIIKNVSDTNGQMKLLNSFSKNIIEDARSRELLEDGINNELRKQYKDMVQLRLEQEKIKLDGKEIASDHQQQVEILQNKIKLNNMLLVSVKMQAGIMNQLKQSNFAAFGPLSGAVKNSVEFVGLLKSAGKAAAIAQVTLLAVEATISSTVKFIMAAVSRFKELDLAAEKFRTDTGFSSEQMSELRGTVENLSVRFSNMGISVEELYNSTKALTDVFGRTSLLTEAVLENVSKLKVNLGVAFEDSAGVLLNFQGLGGVSEEIAMNVIKTSAVLSEKIGVPFRLVMKDVANASDDVLTTIGATPGKLMKAAIAARVMGIELNKLGSQQKTLLNYSESITSELEASALLGRNITFMKARQLAFEGKAKESMIETLNVVKQMGNFNAMTPYQRAAVAKATGMELKDLTKALAVDKARNSIYYGTNKAARDRLIAQEAALENLEKETDMTGEALMDERDRVLEQQKMQGLLTKLKNTMTSLFVSIGTLLEPVIRLLAIFATGLNYIAGGLGGLTASLDKFSKGLSTAIGLAIIGLGTLASYMSFKWASGMLTKSVGSLVGSIMNAAKDRITVEAPKMETAMSTGAPSAGKAAAEAAPSVSSKVTDAAAKTDKVGKGVNYGGGIKVFLRNFTDGLSYFGRPSVMKGYLGIALMGASLLPFIGAMYLFTKIDWAKAVDGISALAIVSTIAGIIGLNAPLLIKGAGALAILGFALLPLAITFAIVGKASQEFSTGIVVAKNAIVEILEKANPLNILAFGAAIAGMTYALAAAAPVAAIAGAGLLTMTLGLASLAFAISIVAPNAEKFGKGMKQGVSALKMLADIKFISLSSNMKQLNEFLETSNVGMSELVSSLFGNDAITKIEQLSKMSGGLAISADAIQKLVSSFKNFSQIGGFATAIDGIVLSFNKLTPAIIEQLYKMSNNITPIAEAIAKMILSFQNFGAVDSFTIAIGKLETALSGLFGTDDLSKMEKLSNISAGLAISAEAIQKLMTSMQSFTQVDSFANAIGRLATSLSGLNTSISALDVNKLGDVAKSTSTISTAASTPQASNTPNTQFDTTKLEAKIDELAKALYDRPIQLYLDSKQISSGTAKASGS